MSPGAVVIGRLGRCDHEYCSAGGSRIQLEAQLVGELARRPRHVGDDIAQIELRHFSAGS